MVKISRLRNGRRGLSLALLAGAAAAALLGACGSDGNSESTLAAAQDSGTIASAIAHAPPYTVLEEDGTVTGMVPELTDAVFERLGVSDVNYVVTTWDSMIPGLQAGRWDTVASGLILTEERCQQVPFSAPITVDDWSALVETGNPHGVREEADVVDTDATIAAVPGTGNEQIALAAGVDRSQLVSVPDAQAARDAVEAGRADVFFAATLEVENLSGSPDVEIVKSTADVFTETGNAFRPEDRELRDAFDEELEKLKQDGTYANLAEEWGFNPELGVEATHEDAVPAIPSCIEEAS